MALFYTHKAIEHTHNTKPSPPRTTLSDVKVAFRLLETLLRCSAVHTGGDKHEGKHIRLLRVPGSGLVGDSARVIQCSNTRGVRSGGEMCASEFGF